MVSVKFKVMLQLLFFYFANLFFTIYKFPERDPISQMLFALLMALSISANFIRFIDKKNKNFLIIFIQNIFFNVYLIVMFECSVRTI